MSDDIVAELDRWLAEWHRYFADTPSVDWAVIRRARDEIIALRGENREMRRTFGSHPLFKEARDEALEEAAQRCDRLATDYTGDPNPPPADNWSAGCVSCAAAIRALKGKG